MSGKEADNKYYSRIPFGGYVCVYLVIHATEKSLGVFTSQNWTVVTFRWWDSRLVLFSSSLFIFMFWVFYIEHVLLVQLKIWCFFKPQTFPNSSHFSWSLIFACLALLFSFKISVIPFKQTKNQRNLTLTLSLVFLSIVLHFQNVI